MSGTWMDSLIGVPLLAQIETPPLPPLLILLLAIVAGVGTVLLLPGAREAAMRRIGGALLIVSAIVLAAFLFRWAAGNPAEGMGKGGMNAYFWIFSAIALVGAMRV